MKLALSKTLKKNLQGTFNKYEFEVGITEDKPHKMPVEWNSTQTNNSEVLTKFAGATVRKASRKNSDKTVAQVSKEMRQKYDYLVAPFKKKDAAIQKLIRDFFNFAFGRSEMKRLENTLQAVVRNPILKKQYGSNTKATQNHKGFDHVMMDTAQFFKAIKAKVKVRRV